MGIHIGINAQLLSFSQNYRNGGVSRYICYLLTALAQAPGEHEYTVFVNGQNVVDHLNLIAQHPQITYLSMPWPESKPAARVAWEQFSLPSLIRQKQIDVLHSPVNVLPEWLPGRCASVVTLHDLAFLRFPHVLTRVRRLYHRTFTIRSLRHASLIIAVSDSTKEDAHTLVGIPYERISTVYPCIDGRFSNVPADETVTAFRTQKGLSDGFVLYLSTLEPRKNVLGILNAYARVRQKYGIREKLVLAGGKGWLYDTIFARVEALDLQDAVIFPGFVPDSEQDLWYRASAAFIYPSLYEGFGIPVAEALACGVPVVTSTVSSLPEAGSGIALCVDPYDIEALADALYRAITDPVLRATCQARASEVRQRFSASRMAQGTIAAYEQAAQMHTHNRKSIARRNS